MPDKPNPKSGNETIKNRRESDRGGKQSGIQEGGRRKSDRPRALPRSKAASIAIACSFLFSLGLIAWAFTLPFRSGTLDGLQKTRDIPEAELVNMEYEAQLSNQAYVQYGRDLDHDLIKKVRAKERDRLSGDLPTPRENRKKWEQGIEQRHRVLQNMRKENGSEDFLEGTIQWQNQKDFEKLLEDEPPKA